MEKKMPSKKRKTKYNSKWEENYPWLMSNSNESYARCNICDTKFSIAFGGISHIVQHMQTEKHQNNLLKIKQIKSSETTEIKIIKKDFDATCRICLQIDCNSKLISIFDYDKNNIKIAKKIYDISGIFIDNTDLFPKQICNNCNDTLSIAYNFRLICQESEIRLKEQEDTENSFLNEVKSEGNSNAESELLEEFFIDEDKEWSNLQNDNNDNIEDEKIYIIDENRDFKVLNSDFEKNKSLEQEKPARSSTKRYCRFRSVWLQKYDFIKEGRNNSYAFCTVCNCEFSIAYGGEHVILKHITRDKHYYNLNPNKKSEKLIDGTSRVRCPQTIEELSYIICEICGNKFPSKRHLRRHLKHHSDVKEHECEICKKQFRELMYLKRHMRVHTGEKPYGCKYCDKKYGDYSSKIKHERVHTNERPYVCQTCGKAFMISDTLKKHIMTHTGEKPFSCEICGVKFSRKTHLQAHEQSLTHKSRANRTDSNDIK